MTFSTAWSKVGARLARSRGSRPSETIRALASALLSRAGERDHRVGAEADVGGLAVEAYPLRPGLGESAGGGGFHKKAQAVSAASVAVATGNVDGVDESGGESLGAFLGCWCYHFRYHNYGKYAHRCETSRNEKVLFIRLLSEPGGV